MKGLGASVPGQAGLGLYVEAVYNGWGHPEEQVEDVPDDVASEETWVHARAKQTLKVLPRINQTLKVAIGIACENL